ncbi:MAG TPA: hypothetical protein VMT55_01650 [Candidatus Sulfotelmatobacter sp.]|nr:hypothetical protein [Candidatus Sulfotelmatobacter sp.]
MTDTKLKYNIDGSPRQGKLKVEITAFLDLENGKTEVVFYGQLGGPAALDDIKERAGQVQKRYTLPSGAGVLDYTFHEFIEEVRKQVVPLTID